MGRMQGQPVATAKQPICTGYTASTYQVGLASHVHLSKVPNKLRWRSPLRLLLLLLLVLLALRL